MAADEFVIPWRPRFYEVDQQGVVFNAWYLAWFDEAMSAFLESRGLDYAAMAAEGIDFQLVHTEIDWRSGVRWGEHVELAVRPSRLGTTSFEVSFVVRRAREQICAARIVYVATTRDGAGKTPVPDLLRTVLSGEASATGSVAAVTPRV
jgi:acyl-CoA thioester hydrolase